LDETRIETVGPARIDGGGRRSVLGPASGLLAFQKKPSRRKSP
jgi:hypothetical protein